LLAKADGIAAFGSDDSTHLDKLFRNAKFKAFAAANGISVKKEIIFLSVPREAYWRPALCDKAARQFAQLCT